MVEVAKALLLDARILIMDEPTSALAEAEINQLFETIHMLKQRDVAIIYISHRLDEIFEIGDRVTVLRDGQRINCQVLCLFAYAVCMQHKKYFGNNCSHCHYQRKHSHLELWSSSHKKVEC